MVGAYWHTWGYIWPMKIQFDATQEYQLDAIRSVTDLFDGQPLKQEDSEINLSGEAQTGMFLS